MRLLSVRLDGFRSFVQENSLHFPKGKGLFLLKGENEAEPELGSNGSGKSTLGDAICWCFAGKTSRGQRGSAIDPWDGAAQTYVEVRLKVQGELVKITRTRHPNTLLLDGEPITQEELEDELGFNYNFLLHTTLLGQHNVYFLDQSPAQKLELFSSILDLDRWTTLSTRAGERVKKLEERIQGEERRIARSQGAQESLREALEEAREAHRRWKSENKKARERARERQEEADQKLRSLQEELQTLEKQARNNSKTLKDLRERREGEEERLRVLDREVRKLQSTLGYIEKTRNLLKEREEVLKGEECDNCGQNINKETRERLTQQVRNEDKEQSQKESRTKQKIRKGEREEKERKKEVVVLRLRIQEEEREEKRIQDCILTTKSNKQQAQAEKKGIQGEGGEERNVSPFLEVIMRGKERIGEEEEKESQALRSRGLAQKGQYRTSYWQKGFQELRLWVIQQALQQLEVECNSFLVELGLRSWYMRFLVERENKSGGLSKGFHVEIQSPSSGENWVAWESWSGGEGQRLRIAAEAGLANLIRSCTRFSLPWEFWDEPTNHLSSEGINDLLAFFSNRAREQNRQVWLVDHRALHSGEFDGITKVRKTLDRGSTLHGLGSRLDLYAEDANA